jgi:hypothetical protein
MRGRLLRGSWMLLFAVLATAACDNTPATPSIAFTKVPAAAKGGPDTLDIIEGRITDARPGQRLVLYARSSVWWVQPSANMPFTEIRGDSTFSAKTHLGKAKPPRHTLQFGGYEWTVRAAPSDRGGPNQFDPSNAWTDSEGALHLRIAGQPGKWTCAELSLTRSFGYGLYTFTVDDVSTLDPAARFAIFTWDGPAVAQYGREMSINIGRYGDRPEDNARYVVQPSDIAANRSMFYAPPGLLTHQLRWEPERAIFRTYRGARAGEGKPIAEHTFSKGVPGMGNETIRMSLFVFQRNPTPMQKPAEVVVRRFTFEP